MPSQALAFAEILAGGVLITAAFTGQSVANVVAGKKEPVEPLATPLGGKGSAGSTLSPDESLTTMTGAGVNAGGTKTFEGTRVADWIYPILVYARQHGWKGKVTSGWRSYAEQLSLNRQGLFSAPAGTSNHEKTKYPGGAVDVSQDVAFANAIKGYPGRYKLIGHQLGAVDPEHFSATGH